MARLDKIGAFALTEPDHGSDSVSLETTARRDGDSWVLNGRKKWIGNGTIADVVVVWARDIADGQVKGFLVEKGTPGYTGPSHRAQGLVAGGLAGRDRARGRPGRRTRTGCPGRTRSPTPPGCSPPPASPARGWRSATPSPDSTPRSPTPAVAASSGSTLAHFQIIQQRLVRMLADVTAMQLYCLQIGPARRAGRAERHPRRARQAAQHHARPATVLAEARDLLGGNGILLDFHVMRHMADIEAVHTFEGTETMQTLIVGRDITGISAFTR